MTKSRQDLCARVSQAAGRRKKKPTSRVESAFNDVAKLVRGAGDRLFGDSDQGADATKRKSAKKTATDRKRGGQKRQAAAKKGGAARIRSGQRRQAAAKNAARKRGAKTT